jgi:hypothetical protein
MRKKQIPIEKALPNKDDLFRNRKGSPEKTTPVSQKKPVSHRTVNRIRSLPRKSQ